MYTIGWLIKNERIRKKITQEQLCHGICSTSYYSKVENGYAAANQIVIKMLLERLGINQEKYMVYRDQREYELDQLKFEIRRSNALSDFILHKEKLIKIKDLITESDHITKQFYILHQCFIERRENINSETILINLIEALSLTKSEIDYFDLTNELLTLNEAVIINNIAIQKYIEGHRLDGIKILRELKKYYEKHYDDYENTSKAYIIVLTNLCKWLYQEKNYFECIGLCDYSLDIAIKYNILDIVLDISYYKGVSLSEIGNIDEGKDYIIQSYYIAKLTKATIQKDIIKKVLYDRYQLRLD